MNIEIYDSRCFLYLKHVSYKSAAFALRLEFIDKISYENETLKIYRTDSQDCIKIKFEPNFSIEVSNISET